MNGSSGKLITNIIKHSRQTERKNILRGVCLFYFLFVLFSFFFVSCKNCCWYFFLTSDTGIDCRRFVSGYHIIVRHDCDSSVTFFYLRQKTTVHSFLQNKILRWRLGWRYACAIDRRSSISFCTVLRKFPVSSASFHSWSVSFILLRISVI